MPLGDLPTPDVLVLSPGADFVLNGSLEGDLVDDVLSMFIVIEHPDGDITWDADIDLVGGTAKWFVQSTVTDTIPNRTPYKMYALLDTTPVTDVLLYHGRVERRPLE